MTEMSKEDWQKAAEKIKEIGALAPCPRCGKKNFTLLEGYLNPQLQPKLDATYIGGPTVPCVGVACTHCGFVSMHALGVLGLLPKEKKHDKPTEPSKK